MGDKKGKHREEIVRKMWKVSSRNRMKYNNWTKCTIVMELYDPGGKSSHSSVCVCVCISEKETMKKRAPTKTHIPWALVRQPNSLTSEMVDVKLG